MQEMLGTRAARMRRGIGIVLLLYWCALFVSTHIPDPERFLPPDLSDKLLHFLAFAGLAYLTALCQSVRTPLTISRYLFLAVLLLLYSIIDETLQLIPFLHRSADLADLATDIAGVVTGLAVLHGTHGFLLKWFGVPRAEASPDPLVLSQTDDKSQ